MKNLIKKRKEISYVDEILICSESEKHLRFRFANYLANRIHQPKVRGRRKVVKRPLPLIFVSVQMRRYPDAGISEIIST
jgi:hypothetical protein